MEKIYELNEEQDIAMRQIDGAVLVTAGAGSGKTRLLTHRIAYMIDELKIAPENILAITFTNKAAGEMKERVEKMTEGGKRVWISTFHSMCATILRGHINKLDPRYNSNFSIYADAETEKVLKTIYAKRGIEDDALKKKMSFHISNCKNNNKSYDAYRNEFDYERNIDLIIAIMEEYNNYLTENNALDFNDLLCLTYKLFIKRPDVLDYYSQRFCYVLVDEFQDTNEIQYDIVKLLTQTHKNIFAVGDEDQCIYTWRGANFKNIFRFKKDFSDVKVFKLERNYRSTKTIIATANKLIKHNKSRIDKTLWTDKEGPYPIEYKEVYDEQAEADYVAKTIHNLVKQHDMQYSDFAILLRLNALTLPFEEKLLAYNIPHKIFGGFKFYERQEIKNVIAYLKLFINPKDEQAFIRIINFPKRGIGDGAINKIKEISDVYHLSLLETILQGKELGLSPSILNKVELFCETYKTLFTLYETTPLEDFCQKVVDDFQIKKAYPSTSEEDMDKLMNIEQLLLSIKNFAEKNERVTLSEYLQSVSLISDIDSLDGSNNVIVATVHSVKGLEFKCVFVVGLEEKIFPISRAFGEEDQMEEERRLMYVAITRAEEMLYLSNCKTRYLYGHRDYMMPSRFLEEIDCKKTRSQTPILNTKASRTANSQIDYIKQTIQTIPKPTYTQILQNSQTKNQISNYKVGQMVLHIKFGIGKIVEIDTESITADINFEGFGIKTLMLEIAPLKIIK